MLGALDRQIDRQRAASRAELVKEKMRPIDFQKAKNYVLVMVIGSMQALSDEEQEELGRRMFEIEEDAELTASERSYALGFVIVDLMGEKAFECLFPEKDRDQFVADE